MHGIPSALPLRLMQVLKSRDDWFVVKDVHVSVRSGGGGGGGGGVGGNGTEAVVACVRPCNRAI